MKITHLFRIMLVGCLVAVCCPGNVFGQSQDVSATDSLASEQGTLQSLEALQRALAMKEAEADSLQKELAATSDEVLREDVKRRLQDIRSSIEEQRQQFDGFAMDIDLSPFSPHKESKFDWQEQVGKLLEPIVAEFANATAESRVIGQLRLQIDDVRKRRDLASKAVTNLETLLAQPASPELRTRLENRLEAWKRIQEQNQNEFSALDLQLQSRLATRESVLDQTTGYAKNFFKTRGLNLLLGILAFCAVFFGFRLGETVVRKLRRKGTEKKFSSRLTALLFHLFSVLGGLVAMMLAFNMAGDWFLLGIVIIFLFGVGWASINTLPQQVETIKLMLNIGAVREGEFLVYEGTPYCVESLGFSAKLKNPRLDGGTRLLPVKYLVGMNSRPVGKEESWFPCEAGEWVELADGQAGQVLSQTPAAVQLAVPGGKRVVYPTAAFLGLHPKNLSGGFRVTSTFGVDYRHQAVATSEIPAKMRAKLQAELPKLAGAENVVEIQVLFSCASSSSLDYAVWVDLKGAAAPLSMLMPGTIQRILVEACNENGWVIPFTQVTVHKE
ncbi:MAG: hypothetical protein V1791_15435 [Pseudomonadota bacterium]